MNALARELFNNTAQEDVLHLWQDGAVRSREVADLLNLQSSDIAKLANVAKTSVRFDEAAPKALVQRMEEIADIANMVAHAFSWNAQKTALWFRTTNPVLGDISPRDMLRFGRYEKLRRFIVGALTDLGRDEASRVRNSTT